MRVLSLFDGISAGQLALKRAGITVTKYYASEIDKHAIAITQYNFPETIQLGDVTKWQDWDIDQPDILLAGFPCQAWSTAGKMQGDNDPRGALVHDLIAVWNHYKPKWFLFENVKMKKEFMTYINDLFGVEGYLINSALVSAQNRQRYYWFGTTTKKHIFDFEILDGEKRDTKEIGRIQNESQDSRESEILGEAQGRYCYLQDLWEGISEDKPQGNYKDMLRKMLYSKQEIDRQKSEQEKTGRISEEIQLKKQRKNTCLSSEVQKVRKRQGGYAKNGCTTSQENSKKHENPCKEADFWAVKQKNNKGRYRDNTKDEVGMCSMQDKEGFMYRSCDSTISRWNELLEQSTNTLQGVQFIEKRQNNGRIYGLFEYNIERIELEQPEDKGILLKDVVECDAVRDKSKTVRVGGRGSPQNSKQEWDGVEYVDRDKSYYIDANYHKGGNPEQYFTKKRRQLAFKDKSQTILSTIYKENAKSMIKRKKWGLLVPEESKGIGR